MMRHQKFMAAAAASALALTLAACNDDSDDGDDGATPDDLTELEIVGFQHPSLGAFLPSVIMAEDFDESHGLDITFVERPPDVYNQEFTVGQYEIGASGSLMSEARRLDEGVDVVYLFNVHDYWGGLVSTTDSITDITDLEGHTLSGATSSTNWAMFLWFAQAAGVDMDNVGVEIHDTGALGGQAQTGRTDAVQLWEPAYANLMVDELENVTDVPLPFDLWEEEFGTSDIPFLGVAVHREWLDEHEEEAEALQRVYEEAAEWTLANPEAAAEIIAEDMGSENVEALTALIADNDRLGLNVRPASEIEEGIQAVFEAGVDIEYFDSAPSLTLIPEN